MTTRMLAIGGALLLLTGCNAIQLLSGDRAGLPCSVEEGCGEGFACVEGACVKGARDGGSGGDAAGHDGGSRDTLFSDVVIPDGASAPPWDLTVTGSGFGVLNNTQVVGVLLDASGVIEGTVVSTIGNFQTFTLTWTDVLQPATSYRVHLFFDLDGDGQCRADAVPPAQGEMGFSVTVGMVTGDKLVTVTSGPGLTPTDVCASFGGSSGLTDLTIDGADFAAFQGSTLRLVLYTDALTTPTHDDSFVLTQAGFSRVMLDALDGSSTYLLSWWVEQDANDHCSQDDTGGTVEVGVSIGVTSVTLSGVDGAPYGCLNPCDLDKDFVDSDAAGCTGTDCDDLDPQRYPGNVDICADGIDQDCSGDDAVCPGFDLALTLSGFAPGATFALLVYDVNGPGDAGGIRLSDGFDASGAAVVNAPSILYAGHSYALLLFLDNGDGLCDPAADQRYAYILGEATANRTLALSPAQLTATDCATITRFQMAAGPWGDHNVAFVTSATWQGDLGGLDGADQKCRDAAAAAGLPDQAYRAWLSTDVVAAIDRLQADLGWVRPDGAPFGLGKASLLSGAILAPLAVDETGALQVSSYPVFTGTTASLEVGMACSGWVSASNGSMATVGDRVGGTGAWTAFTTSACDNDAHLYCLGDLPTAASVQEPSTTGLRRAFVSTGTWKPSAAGIASADALCASEANAAGLTAGFTAMLAPSGSTAVGRLNQGPDWVRADGARVLAGGLADVDRGLLVPLNVTADGDYEAPPLRAWTGAPLVGAGDASSTCADWLSASGTGIVGDPSRSGGSGVDFATESCASTSVRLYCFEH